MGFLKVRTPLVGAVSIDEAFLTSLQADSLKKITLEICSAYKKKVAAGCYLFHWSGNGLAESYYGVFLAQIFPF